MNLISNLLHYTNHNPSSALESAGDYLIDFSFSKRERFTVIRKHNSHEKMAFLINPLLQRSILKIVAMAMLPLAMIGLLLKSIALLTDQEMRDLYLNMKVALINYNEENLGREKIFKIAEEKNLLAPLLDDVAKNRFDYLLKNDYKIELFRFLEECACENDYFNCFINNRRSDLENRLTQQALERFPDKSKQIRYVSLGSGNLLQDLFQIYSLLQKGYKNIDIILIDPCNKDNKDALRLFSSCIQAKARELDVQLNIHPYNSYQDYNKANQQEKIDILVAVDFEVLDVHIDDVVNAHAQLSDQGFFHLSFFAQDFEMDKEKITFHKSHPSSRKVSIVESQIFDEMKILRDKGKKTMSLAYILQTAPTDMLRLIHEAKKQGFKKIEISVYNGALEYSAKMIQFLSLYAATSPFIDIVWHQCASPNELLDKSKRQRFDIATIASGFDCAFLSHFTYASSSFSSRDEQRYNKEKELKAEAAMIVQWDLAEKKYQSLG